MSKQEALKPCPFCGSPAKWKQLGQSGVGHVYCKRADKYHARLESLEGVVEAAKKWKPTVRGASRDHLIPEALALVDALDALEAKEETNG